MGWQPVVITPLNPDIALQDSDFLNEIPETAEVHRIPIFDPSRFVKGKSTSSVKNDGYSRIEGRSLKMKMAKWIRGNLFIPDSRKGWRKPVMRFLKTYLAENPVDLVVSTGPPHSMHGIGQAVKNTFDIPWIMDLRDPMSKLIVNKEMGMSAFALRQYERYEQRMLRDADSVISTSPAMPELLMPFDQQKFHCITNGYDEADFRTRRPLASHPFILSHVGMLVKQRIPYGLIKALDELLAEDETTWKDFQWHIAGIVSPLFWEEIEKYPRVKSMITFLDYISHQEALDLYQKSTVLLLCMNDDGESARGVVPGKLFEYLAACRPLLSIGPANSVYLELIEQNGYIQHVDHSDMKEMKKYLQFVRAKLDGFSCEASSFERFARKSLTTELVKHFNQVLKQDD